MTEPRGPIDAARQQQTEREQQPARKLLDQMNDRELAHLYGERDLARHLLATVQQTSVNALNRAEQAERVAQSAARDTARALEGYLAAEQRAEQAEAAIERVQARCQRVRDRVGPSGMINASQILGLLSPTWPDGNYETPPTRAALDEPKEPTP